MSEMNFYDGAKVRLRGGEYDEIIPCHKRWQLKRVGLGVCNSGRVLLGTNDQYDVVEILPPEPAPVPTVELGKWYPCRDAQWRCKVLETGLPGLYAWAGIRRNINKENGWLLESWTAKGHCMNDAVESRFDLMLAPPEPKRYTVTRWVNCYAENGKVILSTLYETRTRADGCASRDRIACVPCTIEFTEGEGLS